MIHSALMTVSQLKQLANQHYEFRNGCLLDTNILVSASLPIDPFNEDAENLIETLRKFNIPVYSNVNIRAEFLEIQRRLLIPECLLELNERHPEMDTVLSHKIKSVQTSYRKSIENKKVYKFSDERIKEFIKIRENEIHPLLTNKVMWGGVNKLMGYHGISSADAMIVNLLFASKLKLVATSDGDIKFLEEIMRQNNKLVLIIQ